MSTNKIASRSPVPIGATERGKELIYKSALSLQEYGFHLHPLHGINEHWHCSCGQIDCPSPGKKPFLKGWKHKATSRPDTIYRFWMKEWRGANIGIVTGSTTKIFTVDIDGTSGEKSLAKLEKEYGEMPATAEFTTGRGRQRIFNYPGGGIKIPNDSKGLLGKDIHIRSDDGYSVGPGSQHINGKVYAWKPGHAPRETPIADSPDWLIDLIKMKAIPTAKSKATQKRKNKLPKRENGGYVHPAKVPKIQIGDSIPDGLRDETIFRFACHYRDRGHPKRTVLATCKAFNRTYCKPPLDDKTVEVKVDSAFERYVCRPSRQHHRYMSYAATQVYQYLTRAQAGRNIWVKRSRDEIVAATNVSKRHISRCIKVLEEEHWLQVRHGSGRGNKGAYLPSPQSEEQFSEKGDKRGTSVHLSSGVFGSYSLSQENNTLESTDPRRRRLSIVK